MNDVFNYYEKYEDETLYNPHFQSVKTQQQMKETNSNQGTSINQNLLNFLHETRKADENIVNTKSKGKFKGPFDWLAKVLKKDKQLIDTSSSSSSYHVVSRAFVVCNSVSFLLSWQISHRRWRDLRNCFVLMTDTWEEQSKHFGGIIQCHFK